MKIGLYFGSFNPIHIGHLIIAGFVTNNTSVNQIWIVVSPENPLKSKSILLNEYHRLHLVRLAIEDDIQLKAVDIEFQLPKPSYTIDTLTYLKEKYPQNEFTIILGSDSFNNLPNWKNFRQLVQECSFIIYTRPGFKVKETWNAKVEIVKAPLLDISASLIRSNIAEGKSIRYLIPEAVRHEIENNGYYKIRSI